MVKPKLVTVTGHRTNTLRHQLNHYKDIVSDIFVVVYENSETSKKIEFEIAEICSDFGLDIHKVKTHKPFDWEMVKVNDLILKFVNKPFFTQLKDKFISNLAPNGYENNKMSLG